MELVGRGAESFSFALGGIGGDASSVVFLLFLASNSGEHGVLLHNFLLVAGHLRIWAFAIVERVLISNRNIRSVTAHTLVAIYHAVTGSCTHVVLGEQGFVRSVGG